MKRLFHVAGENVSGLWIPSRTTERYRPINGARPNGLLSSCPRSDCWMDSKNHAFRGFEKMKIVLEETKLDQKRKKGSLDAAWEDEGAEAKKGFLMCDSEVL